MVYSRPGSPRGNLRAVHRDVCECTGSHQKNDFAYNSVFSSLQADPPAWCGVQDLRRKTGSDRQVKVKDGESTVRTATVNGLLPRGFTSAMWSTRWLRSHPSSTGTLPSSWSLFLVKVPRWVCCIPMQNFNPFCLVGSKINIFLNNVCFFSRHL